MTWVLILTIAVLVLFIGTMPKMSRTQSWRYAPASSVGMVLTLVVVLLLLGKV